jgi:hypothetical protein
MIQGARNSHKGRASSIGTSGWRDLVRNGLAWRSDSVRTALKRFGAMIDFADPQASKLTWDQATRKLASGGCAFQSMNDSAYGELVAGGAREGVDFGATAFPGTGDSFLAVVDVFVAATKAKNAKNALAFLGGIDEPSTRLPFSRAKGSIPVVRDVDVSRLPALPASVLEGVLDLTGAAVGGPRRGAEPGVPGRLLRRSIQLRANKGRRSLRQHPRKRRLREQDPPALMRPDYRRARASSGCGRARRRLGDRGCASTGSRGGARAAPVAVLPPPCARGDSLHAHHAGGARANRGLFGA